MRNLIPTLPFLLAMFAVPLHADGCRDEIAALYDGPLDPFQRPPHRQVVQVHDADGNALRQFHNTIETPLRTISGEVASQHFTLVVDRDIWNGPSPEGPWTANPAQMPEGREEAMRTQYAQLRANMTDTVCHGTDADGRISYSYRSQTDKDATGSFFGSHDRIWIDPDTGQIVRFELTDFVNAWSSGVSAERHVIEVTFDPSIKVKRPD